jgi:hypothetical protein
MIIDSAGAMSEIAEQACAGIGRPVDQESGRIVAATA